MELWQGKILVYFICVADSIIDDWTAPKWLL